jgi:hypothetical protein
MLHVGGSIPPGPTVLAFVFDLEQMRGEETRREALKRKELKRRQKTGGDGTKKQQTR